MNLRKHIVKPLPLTGYGPEVLCAGWNPVAVAVPEAPVNGRPGAVLATDADTFLDLFYRLQQT